MDHGQTAAARYPRAALVAAAVTVLAAVLLAGAVAARTPDSSAPAAAHAERFWVGGDSLSYYVGTALADDLRARGAIAATAEPDARRSSGLLSPGFFDWQTHAREIVAADPDLVVLMLGTNDAALDVFTPAAYEDAAARMMDALEGRTVMWVGIPNMADGALAERAREANEAAQRAARGRPWVHYVDTWDVTSRGGDYAATVDVDGVATALRADDGIHLTPAGGRVIAREIARAAVGD